MTRGVVMLASPIHSVSSRFCDGFYLQWVQL
jgi:hypothetical protein